MPGRRCRGRRGGGLFRASGNEQPARLVWRGPDKGGRPLTAASVDLLITAQDNLLEERLELRRTVPLPAAGPARAFAVWTANSMTRVLPSTVPDAIPDRPQAQLSLAGNEAESFQIVLLGPVERELRNVTVEVSDLVSADGKARIARDRIEWQQVGWIRLEKLTRHPAYPEAVAGWWPDPLLDFLGPVDVAVGDLQSFWVRVRVPKGQAPGVYRGTLTVAAAGLTPLAFGFVLRVYAADSVHLAGAFNGWATQNAAYAFVPDGDGRAPCMQCRTCDTFACAIAAKNDLANARLVFENGCVANLTASRASDKAMRKMRIFTGTTYASIDFADRTASVYERKGDLSTLATNPPPGFNPKEFMLDKFINVRNLVITPYDQLEQELTSFVDAIQGNKTPVVSGTDGRDALAICHKILAKL